MALSPAVGYNFKFTVDDKTFVGVTQDDLTVSAIVKESITKDDGGVKKKRVTGHEITHKIAGIMELGAETTSAVLDNDDIIDLALKTGDDAEIEFTYLRGSGQAYEGDCIITGYSESTPADGEVDSTYSLDIAVIGNMTKVTGSSNL